MGNRYPKGKEAVSFWDSVVYIGIILLLLFICCLIFKLCEIYHLEHLIIKF